MENLNKSFEPMDVDLSAQSTSAMDVSCNNSASEIQAASDEDCFIVYSNIPKRATASADSSSVAPKSPVPLFNPKTEISSIKKYHINIKSQIQPHTNSRIVILTVLCTLFVSILIYNSGIHCYREPNFEDLREKFSTHLFGQEEAVESIISALKMDRKHKMLIFYGGTGVGKTLTSSIIMQNLGLSSNLYHYTMPTFSETFSSDLMLGLIICESATIIIDDLRMDNNVSEQINKVIDKSDHLKRNLTIILIYNCAGTDNLFHKKCDESVQTLLFKKYQNTKVSFYFVKFKSLTDFHLKKCIDKELGDVKLDQAAYEKIEKKFNVSSDGCKGVHTKVKLLNML